LRYAAGGARTEGHQEPITDHPIHISALVLTPGFARRRLKREPGDDDEVIQSGTAPQR
jgi:hypothetical protein